MSTDFKYTKEEWNAMWKPAPLPTHEEIEKCIQEGNSYGYTNAICRLYNLSMDCKNMLWTVWLETRDESIHVESDPKPSMDEATIDAYRKMRELEVI